MATAASISRLFRFLSTKPNSSFFFPSTKITNPLKPKTLTHLPPTRPLTSSSNTNSPTSFNFSDSEDEDKPPPPPPTPNLPPPYDPFNKKPAIEEPQDPKDLQQIFHKMRTDGLTNNAIKMFDALSKDGLTHEAMELFAVIKDKGNMPDVVAHTAVMEAYANAGGHSKEAVKVFLRMISAGVKPNAYTYSVLIKGLAKDGKLKDARKYLLECLEKGVKVNAGTYTTVFEAFVVEGKVEEGEELLEVMKGKGFVPDEDAVRDCLTKRGILSEMEGCNKTIISSI